MTFKFEISYCYEIPIFVNYDCIVCHSSKYGVWMSIWYPQTVLKTNDNGRRECTFVFFSFQYHSLFLWKSLRFDWPMQLHFKVIFISPPEIHAEVCYIIHKECINITYQIYTHTLQQSMNSSCIKILFIIFPK